MLQHNYFGLILNILGQSVDDEQKIKAWVDGFGWYGPLILIVAMIVQMFLLIIRSGIIIKLSRINKCASCHAFIAGAINRDSDDRYIHLVTALNDLWLKGLQKSHSKALSNIWVYYFDLLYECMSSCFWTTKSQLA